MAFDAGQTGEILRDLRLNRESLYDPSDPAHLLIDFPSLLSLETDKYSAVQTGKWNVKQLQLDKSRTCVHLILLAKQLTEVADLNICPHNLTALTVQFTAAEAVRFMLGQLQLAGMRRFLFRQ